MKNQLEIIIVCCKKDFFLTKLCVASIRYYYPTIKINLVKDHYLGSFSTKELEKNFDVKILDLGIQKYGWTTAKIHILSTLKARNKKFLLLDSDLVFIGRVLDKLLIDADKFDFIVDLEKKHPLGSENYKYIYFDQNVILKKNPDFQPLKYGFNSGEILFTPGKLTKKDLKDYINFDSFPYWNDFSLKHFPCRDQGLLNILIPLKSQRKQIKLKRIDFMKWGRDKDIRDVKTSSYSLEGVRSGKYHYLIHWAGDHKNRNLDLMSRSDILYFFQDFYYSHIPFGKIRQLLDQKHSKFFSFLKRIKRNLYKIFPSTSVNPIIYKTKIFSLQGINKP